MRSFMRQVIDVSFYNTKYNRPGEGTKKFTLICGHAKWVKQSYKTPVNCYCNKCALSPKSETWFHPTKNINNKGDVT
jgi:hypothetical protein